MQKDTDGTQLHVPDSPSSSSMRSDSTNPEEVAAYCQARNIWTILGGDLNKPGAKQATKVHSHHTTSAKPMQFPTIRPQTYAAAEIAEQGSMIEVLNIGAHIRPGEEGINYGDLPFKHVLMSCTAMHAVTARMPACISFGT